MSTLVCSNYQVARNLPAEWRPVAETAWGWATANWPWWVRVRADEDALSVFIWLDTTDGPTAVGILGIFFPDEQPGVVTSQLDDLRDDILRGDFDDDSPEEG